MLSRTETNNVSNALIILFIVIAVDVNTLHSNTENQTMDHIRNVSIPQNTSFEFDRYLQIQTNEMY